MPDDRPLIPAQSLAAVTTTPTQSTGLRSRLESMLVRRPVAWNWFWLNGDRRRGNQRLRGTVLSSEYWRNERSRVGDFRRTSGRNRGQFCPRTKSVQSTLSGISFLIVGPIWAMYQVMHWESILAMLDKCVQGCHARKITGSCVRFFMHTCTQLNLHLTGFILHSYIGLHMDDHKLEYN